MISVVINYETEMHANYRKYSKVRFGHAMHANRNEHADEKTKNIASSSTPNYPRSERR